MPSGVESSRRRIVARWRSLTGGTDARDDARPTVVALSGGADSSALLIALSAVRRARLVAAHVRHGLRPETLQNRDRDAAASLAERLGVPFVARYIQIPADDNSESAARRLRYAALADIAHEAGCAFIATAHHAEDQLETMLMALTRGAGPAGLAGIRPDRPLPRGVRLVRPTLTITRGQLRAICDEARWEPVHDETNDDLSRRRAWLRARIVPELLAHTDDRLPLRLDATARLMRGAHAMARQQAGVILAAAEREGGRVAIPLDSFADRPAIVIGEVLRQVVSLFVGEKGRDALGWSRLAPIVRAVRQRGMHVRVFDIQGVRIVVSNRLLSAERH